MGKYQGNPVSGGVAAGKVYKHVPYRAIVDREPVSGQSAEEILAACMAAKDLAARELNALKAGFGPEETDKDAIVGAHLEILNDPALEELIAGYVRDGRCNAKWAIEQAFEMFINLLSQVTDDTIRERITDMKDVRDRLLRNCDGVAESNLSGLTEPVIVAAHELYPSDAASLNRATVRAIVTETGGATSHTAIIARCYGIPALLEVPRAMAVLQDGEYAVVDAVDGILAAGLGQAELAEYEKKAAQYRTDQAGFKA